MAYTETQIIELKSITGLDYAKATAFGTKHGISPRSVIAKARALEIPYTPKVAGTKAVKAKAIRRKSDIQTSINELLDMNMDSLGKMTTGDMEALEARVMEMVSA